MDQEKHDKVVKNAGSSEGSKKPSKESAKSFLDKHSGDTVHKDGTLAELGIGLAATAVYVGILAAISAISERSRNKHAEEQKKRNEEQLERFDKESDEDNNKLSKQYMADYADVREFSNENPPKKIVGDHSIDDDAKAINPTFDENIPYTSTNCVLCSVSYDLRRRGYDVTAKMCRMGSLVDKTLESAYGQKVELKNVSDVKGGWDSVLDAKKSDLPDGARGVISVRSPFSNMGHCMSFEVENGRIRVIDAQSGDTDVNLKDKKWSVLSPSMTRIARLDNLEVNMPGISKCCAELKNGWKDKVPKKPGSQVNGSKNANHEKYIEQYRKDHPNTELTDAQILDNYLSVKHSLSDYLAHYGFEGRKWGLGRYNEIKKESHV